MTDKPEFFWRPPDGAPIVGITTFEGLAVIATASGVYVIGAVPETWVVHKISSAVKDG